MTSTQRIFKDACRYGCLELVKVCVENGAYTHNYFNWALRLSILYNHYKIVKFLLEIEANPYDFNWLGEDAFCYAYTYGGNEIVNLLNTYKRDDYEQR